MHLQAEMVEIIFGIIAAKMEKKLSFLVAADELLFNTNRKRINVKTAVRYYSIPAVLQQPMPSAFIAAFTTTL